MENMKNKVLTKEKDSKLRECLKHSVKQTDFKDAKLNQSLDRSLTYKGVSLII